VKEEVMSRFSSWRLRAGAAAIAGAAALALAAQAGAYVDPAMSATVGGPVVLVSGVYLQVPVVGTCSPLTAPFTAIAYDTVEADVTQKVGSSIAWGVGNASYYSAAAQGTASGQPVTCDGLPHTYLVNVFPSIPGSPAFRGGRAVVTVDFGVSAYDPLSGCLFCPGGTSYVQTGPFSVSVRG
jgi:hypothetical protein